VGTRHAKQTTVDTQEAVPQRPSWSRSIFLAGSSWYPYLLLFPDIDADWLDGSTRPNPFDAPRIQYHHHPYLPPCRIFFRIAKDPSKVSTRNWCNRQISQRIHLWTEQYGTDYQGLAAPHYFPPFSSQIFVGTPTLQCWRMSLPKQQRLPHDIYNRHRGAASPPGDMRVPCTVPIDGSTGTAPENHYPVPIRNPETTVWFRKVYFASVCTLLSVAKDIVEGRRRTTVDTASSSGNKILPRTK